MKDYIQPLVSIINLSTTDILTFSPALYDSENRDEFDISDLI